jgi:hypothetical protein
MGAKLPPGTLEKLWSNPANWRTRLFYYCKADPRFMVPKRNRWAGWTMNFAHRAAWIYLVVGIGLTLAAVFASSATHRPAIIASTIVVIVVVSIVSARRRASPDPFEERD